MSDFVYIRARVGGKPYNAIDPDTLEAVKRAIKVYRCDRRVRSYAAGPHEDLDLQMIAHIRRSMTIRGELPSRCYVRQLEERSPA